MKVYELIEALRKMPQDAKVNVPGWYNPPYGNLYKYVAEVEQENVGWCDVNQEPIMEVYII